MGMEDFVQIGGSSSLDTSQMEPIEEICGYQPRSCKFNVLQLLLNIF